MFYNPYFRPYFGGYGYGGYSPFSINAIGSQFAYQNLYNTGTFSGSQIQSPINIW